MSFRMVESFSEISSDFSQSSPCAKFIVVGVTEVNDVVPFIFIRSLRRLVELGRSVNQSTFRGFEVLLDIPDSFRQPD